MASDVRISVQIGSGHAVVSPEPAYVRVGNSVGWSLHAVNLRFSTPFTFEIRFPGKSPFRQNHFLFQGITTRDGVATGDLDAGSASDPGDYKYDVRLKTDGDAGIEIDPYIVVR